MSAEQAKVSQSNHSGHPLGLPAYQAAVYHAVAKFAGKEAASCRSNLIDGQSEKIDITISARVAGCEPLIEHIEAMLTVAGPTTRAGSGPSGKEIAAWFLTRLGVDEKVAHTLLQEMVADYTTNGSLTVNDGSVKLAENYMKLAGASKTQKVNGNVSVSINRQPLYSLKG